MMTNYGYTELHELVEEQRPLLMLDQVQVDLDAGIAIGLKSVSMNEEFFQGHFPGAPIMPGVLQIAAMVQTANAMSRSGGQPDSYQLAGLTRFKFRKPVHPGDRLFVKIEVLEKNSDTMTINATASIEKDVTSQGVLTLRRSEIDRQQDRQQIFAPQLRDVGLALDATTVLDIGRIMNAIPHRYPFLLIDRILHLDTDLMRIVAVKNITANEPYFAGLKLPEVPGYLQAEMGAQAGCALALAAPENQGKLAYFMSIDQAKFTLPVCPGDQLLMDVQVTGRGRFGKGEGSYYVGDRKVSEISLKFAIVSPEA